MIIKRAKDYYENNKERFGQQARCKYRNLSEEKKIKREDMEETDIIMSEKKKQKLKEYQTN